MAEISPPGRLDRLYKGLMVLAISIACIILMKDIVIPLAFAALFSIVLLPVAKKIEKKTGRVLSIILVLFGLFILLALLLWFVVSQMSTLIASLPDLEDRFLQTVTEISKSVNDRFNISGDEQVQFFKDNLQGLSSYMGGFLATTSYTVYFFVQVPIYVFLFMLYREKFRDFFLSVTHKQELIWQKGIEGVIQGYIGGMVIVIFITGTLNSIGLLLLGIEHAIFFGFLSGTLTLIPYVGIAVGAALPTLIALITKDSLWYAVGVIAVHAFVQLLEGNLITPKITGSRISINAMAAILALLIGGRIWGIAGMILAVPAVGILKILLPYSNSLKSLVILLSDEEIDTKKEK